MLNNALLQKIYANKAPKCLVMRYDRHVNLYLQSISLCCSLWAWEIPSTTRLKIGYTVDLKNHVCLFVDKQGWPQGGGSREVQPPLPPLTLIKLKIP